MLQTQLKDEFELTLALDLASRKFGFWTTLRALVLATLRHSREQRDLALLDNRTRRDIGLPPIEVEPRVLSIFPSSSGKRD